MECVYEPRHGFEAQMLKDLLAQEGIEAEVRGADLQGGVGSLPALGLLQLRVAPEQAPAARALLARWESGEMALPDEDANAQRPDPQRPPRPTSGESSWLGWSLLPLLALAWWLWVVR